MAALSMGMAACTNEMLTPEDNTDNSTSAGQESTGSSLKTAYLRTISASADRVVRSPQTKAYPNPGSLELVSTLENLSKEGEIIGFEYESGNPDARYLSATCVYFDDINKTYYVTYHMQGNNYNTTLEDQTSGYIESFIVDDDGNITPGNIYMSENPAELDFDFNHIYFDDLGNTANSGGYKGTDSGVRMIAVGHTSKPTSSGKREYKSMIGKFDLTTGEFKYENVLTGEKILDAAGKSLGNEDAGDVNSVIRKYDWYYLATRKGIAVLNARNVNDENEEILFSPINDLDVNTNLPIENSIYFVRTPGSAKHLCHYYPSYGSGFSFLYIKQEHPKEYTGEFSLPASIINFSMEAGHGTLCGMNTTDSQTNGKAILNSKDFDITSWSIDSNQFDIPNDICPIDGKNVLANLNGRLYACLGKGGLYVRKNVTTTEGPSVDERTLTFTDAKDGNGSRPVNGVFVEDLENYNDGFVYVANGACLTILDRETLEIVAEYSLFKAGEVEDTSANYVHVRKTNNYTGKCPDRIVTVACGQQGVKVFKFVPPTR